MKSIGWLGLSLFLMVGRLSTVHAMIEEVTPPQTQKVSGHELKLNGAGLRTATMLHVRLYVAAFYAPSALTTPEAVTASPGPLRFDFTFLRPFVETKVEDAWRWQFQQSGTVTYPNVDKEIETFATAFGAIKKNGVETVEIEGDETRIYDDGVLRGTIKGRDFQKAFLALWFGSKPVMPTLKTALLGGNGK
jgi:hypothetical protein